MNEQFKITIKIERKNQFKPHYMSAERTFEIRGTRGGIMRSLETIEKKLVKRYPMPEEVQGKGEPATGEDGSTIK